MAISLDDESRLVELHAEWFVRDYLTVDGDETAAARIDTLVPVEIPEPPPGLSTYVEWVDTVAVSSPEPGTYIVDVAYRVLVANGGPYERQPVGGLAVTLTVDSDGAVQLAGLPNPTDVPFTRPMPSGPTEGVGVLELAEGLERPVAGDQGTFP